MRMRRHRDRSNNCAQRREVGLGVFGFLWVGSDPRRTVWQLGERMHVSMTVLVAISIQCVDSWPFTSVQELVCLSFPFFQTLRNGSSTSTSSDHVDRSRVYSKIQLEVVNGPGLHGSWRLKSVRGRDGE